MKITAFLEKKRSEVIERILRYGNLWKETSPRAPPYKVPIPLQPYGMTLDYELFKTLAS